MAPCHRNKTHNSRPALVAGLRRTLGSHAETSTLGRASFPWIDAHRRDTSRRFERLARRRLFSHHCTGCRLLRIVQIISFFCRIIVEMCPRSMLRFGLKSDSAYDLPKRLTACCTRIRITVLALRACKPEVDDQSVCPLPLHDQARRLSLASQIHRRCSS